MAKAYGSITIVDIGDLGQLSVVPESNQPNMVLYDPDSNAYSPNWSNTHLVLTPVVYYGGKQLELTDSGLKVTWQTKIGSGVPAPITQGVSNGVLTVSSNPFNPSTATMISYIVSVSYTEPSMGTTLNASGQITFGLIQNASKVKTITITGESAFLYSSAGKPSFSTITLTAMAKNTTISKWQYKTSTGSFTDVAESNGKTSITVQESGDYFVSNVAVFRVLSSDDGLYDDHTIVKIRDGANGTSTISAVLSNEDQMIPCSASGAPISGAFEDAKTRLTIYEGQTDVTEKWTISIQKTNVDGSATENNRAFAVTSITADTGSVQFTCTRSGYDTFIKKFSLVKIKTGANGVSPTIYSLSVDALAVNAAVSTSGSITGYSPSSLNIKTFSQVGNNSKTPYAGRLQVFLDDASSPAYSSASDESEKNWPINSVKKKIVIKLFAAGAFERLLDTQTVVITSDGKQGETGNDGKPGVDSLSFILGNYSDVIPCTNSGAVAGPINITIPFTVYQGIQRVACTIAVSSGLPSSVTSSSTPGSTSADGSLVIKIPSGNTMDGKDSGEIKLTITATESGKSATKSFSWTKNKQAANGQNSVLFQIFAPQGNVISNNENNVTLETSLVDGSTLATATSYQWAKFQVGSGYSNIGSATSSTYIVQASDVDGYASFRCTAVYKGKSYVAYLSVYDRTDPLQVTIVSTVGDKIINSQGRGLVFAKVYRNGQELDPMKTMDYGLSYPSSPSSGQYFYLLNSSTKTATLKKYSGTAWQDAEAYKGVYNWTLRDKLNATHSQKTGKAIYVDSNVIETKTTFDVEVVIN